MPFPTASLQAEPSAPEPMLWHLQILRTLAASLVVVDHTYNELYHRGVMPAGHLDAAYLLGHLGVSAFFFLSGLLMTRQSTRMYGTPTGPFVFGWRRILRIVPLYWIATVLWFATLRITHVPVRRPLLQLALSFAFVPNVGNLKKLDPILGQGWTLNYEMWFYLLFAMCLVLPRKRGVALMLTILMGLVLAGKLIVLTPAHRIADLWGFYTYWPILLFAAGAAYAYHERAIPKSGHWNLVISPAWLLCVPMLMLLAPRSPFPNAGSTLKWFSVYGALVTVLCSRVRLDYMGWFNRMLARLGMASYATYLFQVWVYAWTIPPIAALYAHFHWPISPTPFVVAAVVAANLLGLAVHFAIELPITRTLRKIQFRRAGAAQPVPA